MVIAINFVFHIWELATYAATFLGSTVYDYFNGGYTIRAHSSATLDAIQVLYYLKNVTKRNFRPLFVYFVANVVCNFGAFPLYH